METVSPSPVNVHVQIINITPVYRPHAVDVDQLPKSYHYAHIIILYFVHRLV